MRRAAALVALLALASPARAQDAGTATATPTPTPPPGDELSLDELDMGGEAAPQTAHPVPAGGAATSATPAAHVPSTPPAGDPLSSEPTDAGETVVRVRRRRRSATSARTSTAEAQRLPGTQGDAIRVVESLPGVGRASFGSGALVLWGAQPDSSRVFIDGVPVPRLFHGGGVRSALNGYFVKDIELVPGAYGADFGGATAGLVSITTAPLREGVHGVASADVLDASVAGSAQLSREAFVGGGFRFGYLDRLLPLVVSAESLQYINVPRYSDYQARGELRLSQNERLSLFVFGSLDTSRSDFTADDPARARSRRIDQEFHRVALEYQGTLRDGASVSAVAWAGLDGSRNRESVGPFPFELRETDGWGGVRASYLKTLAPGLRVHAGLDAELLRADVFRQGSLLRPPREGDVFAFGQPPAGDTNSDAWSVTQLRAAPYVELPFTLLEGALEVTPGFRLASAMVDVSRALPPVGDQLPHGTSRLLVAPEPRLLASWRVADIVSVKGGAGLYHGAPLPSDLSAVFGNPTLGFVESMQGVLGGAVDITRDLSVEAIGFYRDATGVVSRPATPFPAAGAALVQTGESRAYGLQVQLRHRLAHGFTGWVSYTLSRSEVRDRPGADWRLSDYDQTHLLTLVASYELPLGFSIGARFRLITGLPRTPVVGRYFDALTGDYQPVFGAQNSVRLPPIYSLDVRVDKTFELSRDVKLIVFLDVLNVLNRPPAEELLYDTTYARQGVLSGLPIVADLGVRVEI